MPTFTATVAKGVEPDENCLICGKESKARKAILRVRHDGFELYYCVKCIMRAADAVKHGPTSSRSVEYSRFGHST